MHLELVKIPELEKGISSLERITDREDEEEEKLIVLKNSLDGWRNTLEMDRVAKENAIKEKGSISDWFSDPNDSVIDDVLVRDIPSDESDGWRLMFKKGDLPSYYLPYSGTSRYYTQPQTSIFPHWKIENIKLFAKGERIDTTDGTPIQEGGGEPTRAFSGGVWTDDSQARIPNKVYVGVTKLPLHYAVDQVEFHYETKIDDEGRDWKNRKIEKITLQRIVNDNWEDFVELSLKNQDGPEYIFENLASEKEDEYADLKKDLKIGADGDEFKPQYAGLVPEKFIGKAEFLPSGKKILGVRSEVEGREKIKNAKRVQFAGDAGMLEMSLSKDAMASFQSQNCNAAGLIAGAVTGAAIGLAFAPLAPFAAAGAMVGNAISGCNYALDLSASSGDWGLMGEVFSVGTEASFNADFSLVIEHSSVKSEAKETETSITFGKSMK